MWLVLLWIGSLADLALLVLLVATSGFILGGGPEGLHGDAPASLLWGLGMAAAALAPVAGVVLRRSGRCAAGSAVAWLPVFGALVAASL